MNTNKVTVYIPMEKWNRGSGGAWGDGKSGGCANTFIQKNSGVMSHFGAFRSQLGEVVTREVIRINDNKATPDDYKMGALKALLEPYGLNLVFVQPPCAVDTAPSLVLKNDDEDLASV